MILVFPQATQKFNQFYSSISESEANKQKLFAKVLDTYSYEAVESILLILLEDFPYKDEIKGIIQSNIKDVPVEILVLTKETSGSICTLLMAVNYLKGKQVAISSLDQIVIGNKIDLSIKDSGMDLEIPTIVSDKDTLSYLLRDDNDQPIEVFEKKVISNEAIIGIYKVSDFSLFFDISISLLERYKGFRNRIFFISDVVNAYLAEESRVDFELKKYSHYYKLGLSNVNEVAGD